MEMSLSQAETARRLNVSCGVVHRLWNQYKNEESAAGRPLQGHPHVKASFEGHFLACSA